MTNNDTIYDLINKLIDAIDDEHDAHPDDSIDDLLVLRDALLAAR